MSSCFVPFIGVDSTHDRILVILHQTLFPHYVRQFFVIYYLCTEAAFLLDFITFVSQNYFWLHPVRVYTSHLTVMHKMNLFKKLLFGKIIFLNIVKLLLNH